jgi:hypothetical protein
MTFNLIPWFNIPFMSTSLAVICNNIQCYSCFFAKSEAVNINSSCQCLYFVGLKSRVNFNILQVSTLIFWTLVPHAKISAFRIFKSDNKNRLEETNSGNRHGIAAQ